jgi:DNA-binding SARP family transcriptional activator/Tfp pilus assembly protein PilF
MRRLWLLGPARIEQFQVAHSEAREHIVGPAPRFRSRRTVGLLGYLAAERRLFARDLLAALFWPDEAPSRGRANLSRELHNLAQILPDCWESDRRVVAFVPTSCTAVDTYTLLELKAQERWEEAAEMLGGEFLEGLYLDHNPEFENWLLGERERWRGHAETILRHVIQGHIRRGRYADALHHAQHLLRFAPWDEETHRKVMRLSAWTGQRGAALRQFESCRQALREELDVEPALETVTLYQQIQAGILDLPPQLPAYLTEEKARHEFERPPFVGREDELAQLDAFLGGALAGQGRVIFITGGPGRGKTALLEAFSQQAMEKYPGLLVASGKCNAYYGLGDPYLPFRDVMAMLTGDLEGRWDAGAISRDHARRLWAAFSLVVQILLDHGPHLLDVFVPGEALLSRSTATGPEVAPWLPQLREHAKRHWTSQKEVEQSQLFQQVTNVLRTVAQEQPILLILDDIQWADTASISFLFHMGRRLADADSRILIACAYRPEEVGTGRAGQRHPLAKVLSEFKLSFGDVWVDLGRAERSENRRFMDALLDIKLNRLGESFRSALFDRTGGHPLFTIELLGAMQDRGDLVKDADGVWIEGPKLDWQALPVRVEAVIEERIDRLDPELQDILVIASVEGEVFTAQVVAEVQNVPARSILRRLSQDLGWQHRLVREQEEVYTGQRRLSRYRFGHVLFQDYLYQRLCQGERRLLHRDVATAQEKLYAGQLEELAVQLAHHFHQAGDHQQAFHYFSLAGDRAARLYESGEAITHYTRAIQLSEKVRPDVISLAKLHRGRGLASETVGDFERAHIDHTTAQQMAHTSGEHQVEWRALIDLGKLWRSRDYTQAWEYFEAALQLAHQKDDPAVLAASLNWMGNWYANDEQPLRAVEYHQGALKIVEQRGDQREMANTLDLLGIANLLGGDFNASVHYYDRAINLFREMDNRPRLVNSLIGRATIISALAWLASVPATPPPDAPSDFEEAIRIARELDSAADEAWAHWSLGLLQTVHGHFGQAHKDMKSGLHIASEIGHREFVVASQVDLGILFAELFAPDQARRQLEGSLTLAEELHSATMIHLVSGALAGACLVQDDLKSARACLETVILPETPMDTLGNRYCWVRRAELALAQDETALALDITDRLIESAPGMLPGRVITYLWKLKGEALAAMGHTDKACSLLQLAIENATMTGERFLLWRLHAILGRLYHTIGQQQAAEREYSKARSFIDELAATIPDETLQEGFLQSSYSFLHTQP